MMKHPETKQSWEMAVEKLANVTMDRFKKLEGKIDQLVNHNRNLDMQIGQLAEAINSRSQGSLPSKIEVNPKEHCKAIKLRSGKHLGKIIDEEDVVDEEEVPKPAFEEQVEEKSNEAETEHKRPPPIKPYVPPIPFPQRLQKNKLDKQFEKFLEVFR